jgi:hypothetical protein
MSDTDNVDSVLAGMTGEAFTNFIEEKGVATHIEEAPVVEAPAEEAPEAEATEEAPEVDEATEPSLEIDGEKYTAKEIRELRSVASKVNDLEQRMSEADTEKEQLSVWKEMHALAQKYPGLRDKLAQVFSEFEKNPETAGKPIENREPSDEEKLRAAYVDSLIVKEAGAEIDNFVEAAAKEYAGAIPENAISKDFAGKYDKWMYEVLLPAVEKSFPKSIWGNVGPTQIEMVMNNLLIKNGAIKSAEKAGENRMAERLAQEPKGSRIVRGAATRKDASAPEINLKGKSIDEMLASAGPNFFVRNGQ